MSSIRGVKDRRFKFVQLLNSMFEDCDLSLKAKGFIGFCLTKKENWNFHISHLCTVLKEGERAIYSTIEECEKLGYAFRWQPHKDNGDFGSWETIISDSKDEIALLKEELKDNPHFKKSFTDRRFADAQSARAQSVDAPFPGEIQVPIYSNTNSSNTKEQQQDPAAVFSSSHSSLGNTKIYECLANIEIPDLDKKEITNRYPENVVKNAIAWSLRPENPPKKCLSASIKYACMHKIKREPDKLSNFDILKLHFKNGGIYNGAECFLKADGIAFYRGMKHGQIKIDKYFSWEKFIELCNDFGIKFNSQEKK